MVHPSVAEGVHRVEDAYTNWYVVEDGDELTVVDTGHPRSWSSLHELLRRLGHPGFDRNVLDVPGHPHVIFTPGHTYGHCALHLPERGVLLAGDAFVTYNPYRDANGPQIVSGAATADSSRALASLDTLEPLDVAVTLTGHGDPWTGSVASAVAQARDVGPS